MNEIVTGYNGKTYTDNNGYDCRPENLILLTPEQHSYVHVFSCEIYNDKEKSDCV